MKKIMIILSSLLLIVGIGYAVLSAFVIDDPTAESSNIIETKTIVSISEGTSYDIVFADAHGDYYYINRGLERGLNLDSLNAKVLNKTVTLHLAKILGGLATSEHISQLAVDGDIIYTEFN
ncbi:hypothetical protein [Flavivirga algicola]|uniref:Uncharacterized protein n=1 Tax=Flavivirga algicola TaxID=2729136 RepID=A0ABX1RVE2_9FLAO|nr:hypothetical protein [Flavivirga algicola]NMH87008.1 hypothetical protein [Flavivirga algicola]